MSGPILGLDIGGSKISALLVDDDQAVLERRLAPTGGSLGAQVTELGRKVLAGRVPAAVGIGVPGRVDSRRGVVQLGVNLGGRRLPLAGLVGEALGAPTFLEHDARAAALWLVAESGDPNATLAYLSIGTGISVAVVTNGTLLRGATGLAGEIGHVSVVPDGPLCACGLRGCLEAVAAGPAVARILAEEIRAGAPSSLNTDVTPADLFRAAAAGDEVADRIAYQVGAHLARAIRAVVLSFGVERVVIGGGLSRAGEPFLRPIIVALERERDTSDLVRGAVRTECIELLAPDSDAGARGAVLVARAGLAATDR
ncbi:MAG: ROK family protein [Chloroflexota bacterium]